MSQQLAQPTRAQDQSTTYTVVFVLLALLTAAELGTYYVPGLPNAIKLALLVILAATKVALVLLFFMHLKSDNRI
ncbi:MAG: cytochrome C oxidase subunit IV family protein, partial [Caldilineaceae bacterium]|nr:cytochrome C oxidase subunit IV family protein [Caldilineaceae bacterium]